MRNKKPFFVLGAVIALAAALYVINSGVFPKASGARETKGAVVQPAGGHQGHTPEAPAPQKEAEVKAAPSNTETPTIDIPEDKHQLIGLKTVVVSLRPLQKVIRTVGRIEYDERRQATVNTKFEGWIEKLHIDYAGKYVRKGDPLADIYSPELIATQQELLNTLKWAARGKDVKSETLGSMLSRDADTIVEAARQRLRLWDITDEQIRKIEETGKPVRTLTVYSPVNGYVVQKMALKGMRAMPGEKLFDIADLSSVWIISDVYENEMQLVKEGQSAAISLSYFPGKEFSSKIDYIYPALSGDTRTAKVRFTVPNPGGLLKPQMFTNVEIKIGLGKKLAIPEDAVIDTGQRQVVYVDHGDGNFEPREVQLGSRVEGFREVLKGLKAGEKIASSATFLIDSEAQLKNVTPLGQHKH
ncbi:MAG: efflux RND transporter periplasmic adaptor subunit [Nitrospirota bacterium]|nr:efflux RND transporter periplasmic adaptor subunit [Nitrospirota bacterium]